MLPKKELEWYLQAEQLHMWEDSESPGANSLP